MRTTAVIVATLAALLALTVPVQANDHEPGCIQFGLDAGNAPGKASRIAEHPLDCRGQMNLAVGDDADWYVVPIEDMAQRWPGQPSDVLVEVCPDTVRTDPWNPDVHVHAGNKPPSFQGFGLDPAVTSEIGASTNADGCDVVDTSHDFTGQQLLVHVDPASGDGFYQLRIEIG